MTTASIVVSLALVAGFGSGCVSVERVGRPPSAAEIARINDEARAHDTFDLEYAAPTTTSGARPVDSCTGGACGPPATSEPTGIASVDASHVAFTLRDGGLAALPFNDLVGVRTGRTRGRGALIGGAVGAGFGIGLAALIIKSISQSPSENGGPASCEAACGEKLAEVALSTAFIGALLGAAIGTPHVFRFGDGTSP